MKEKIEIAKKLMTSHVELSVIARCIGLTEEKIQSLILQKMEKVV